MNFVTEEEADKVDFTYDMMRDSKIEEQMTEPNLKTLKDLRPNAFNSDGLGFYREDRLKAEAVKWVREDKKRIKQGNIDANILLRRWMVRLNIFEEDLKNEK